MTLRVEDCQIRVKQDRGVAIRWQENEKAPAIDSRRSLANLGYSISKIL